MALPIIYVNTGGSATNSGSTDTASATKTGAAATVSGSVVSLDGSPDLSGIPTDGSATIYINDATNANQKIFKITAVDDALNTVTTDIAPTGVTSSSWAIGGQFVYTPASIEGALATGWIMDIGNTPASRSGAAFLTCRASGGSASGFITVRGKSGVDHPALVITDTSNVIAQNSQTFWKFKNLTITQQGASGNAVSGSAAFVFEDVTFDDCGGASIIASNSIRMFKCQISGSDSDGIQGGNEKQVIIGCYIHDNDVEGIEASQANPVGLIAFNIIDTCGGKGIKLSGATTNATHGMNILHNTIYGCGDSGLEIADADTIVNWPGNILQDNGDAAGEFNAEWAAGAAEYVGYHDYNCLYHQGVGGGANLSGVTVQTNEITTDPQFVDAANGDFRLKAASPCRAASFPGQFLGGGSSKGYIDMGAVQRREGPIVAVNAEGRVG